MKKILSVLTVSVILAGLFAPAAFAEEAASAANSKVFYYAMAAIGCCLAMGLAAIGAAIAQGMSLSKACEGIARNPGASGKITTTLIIGLAMIESLAIYALVVVLIILLMNPFKI